MGRVDVAARNMEDAVSLWNWVRSQLDRLVGASPRPLPHERYQLVYSDGEGYAVYERTRVWYDHDGREHPGWRCVSPRYYATAWHAYYHAYLRAYDRHQAGAVLYFRDQCDHEHAQIEDRFTKTTGYEGWEMGLLKVPGFTWPEEEQVRHVGWDNRLYWNPPHLTYQEWVEREQKQRATRKPPARL
jgi:hypothetical protein